MFIAKNIPLKTLKYNITCPKYNKLTIDKLPIMKAFEKLYYKQLLKEHKVTHCKDKKPVNLLVKIQCSLIPYALTVVLLTTTYMIILEAVDIYGARFMICILTRTNPNKFVNSRTNVEKLLKKTGLYNILVLLFTIRSYFL